jgi:hypothetical protein
MAGYEVAVDVDLTCESDDDDIEVITSRCADSPRHRRVAIDAAGGSDAAGTADPRAVSGSAAAAAGELPLGTAVITATASDDIEIVHPPPKKILSSFLPSGSKGKTNDKDDDEDLMCLGSAGGSNAFVDFPHARAHCLVQPFERGNFNSFCPNCFCYICDVRAGDCTVWAHHCKASASVQYWRRLREDWKSKKEGTSSAKNSTTGGRNARRRASSATSNGGGEGGAAVTRITGNWNFPTWGGGDGTGTHAGPSQPLKMHTRTISIRGASAGYTLASRPQRAEIESECGVRLSITHGLSEGWGEDSGDTEVTIESSDIEKVNKAVFFVRDIESNPDKYIRISTSNNPDTHASSSPTLGTGGGGTRTRMDTEGPSRLRRQRQRHRTGSLRSFLPSSDSLPSFNILPSTSFISSF